MRVTIATGGTLGDVVPFVAIGKRFRAAGHDVRVATSPDYRELAEAHGLSFAAVGGPIRSLLETDLGREWNSTESPRRLAKLTRELLVPPIRAAAEGFHEATLDADLLLFHPFCAGAYHTAERRRVPAVLLPMVPWFPTAELPPVWLPHAPEWGWLRRALGAWGANQFGKVFKAVHDERRAALGLPAFRHTSFFRDMLERGVPFLHLFSPQLVPRPSDWPEGVEVQGFCTLDGQDAAWRPSPELVAFVADHPSPLYVGFGSTTGDKPEALEPLIFGALERLGLPAIVAGGWCGLGRGVGGAGTTSAGGRRVSDKVYVLPYVPHGWAFERVRAVVHHGSTGTFSASLRAGCPTLTVPFFGDQPFWGARAFARGVGPRPVRRRGLSVDGLAAAIGDLVSNESYRRNATRVAEAMREEDGAGATLAFVERWLAKTPATC